MGVLTVDKKALPKIGEIAAARVVQPKEDHITVISAEGTVMRTEAKTISQYNRVARGVSIMQMREDDIVVAIARFTDQEMEPDEDKEGTKKEGKKGGKLHGFRDFSNYTGSNGGSHVSNCETTDLRNLGIFLEYNWPEGSESDSAPSPLRRKDGFSSIT